VAKLDDSTAPLEIRLQPVAEIDPNNSAQPAKVPEETQIVQQAVAELPMGP